MRPGQVSGCSPLSLPVAAVLYVSAEAVNPQGTDRVMTSMATAFTVPPIAARHPAQLYASGSLSILALGGAGGVVCGDRHAGQGPWFGRGRRRRAAREQLASIGPVRVVLLMLPFAVAMFLLAARIWQAAGPPVGKPQPEPTTVPVSSV